MTYILTLTALALPLLLWLAWRWLIPFGAGQGSTAPGVTFQSFPSVTPVVASASGAAQTNTATLPATAGKVTFLEGFDLTGGGATAAGLATVTITGLAGGTITLTAAVAAGAAVAAFTNGVFSIRFPTPLPAGSGGVIQSNTSIAVAAGTYGAGNTAAQCTAYGFQA